MSAENCSLNERINEQFFLFNCLRREDVISQIIFIVKVDIVPLCYYLLPVNYDSLVPYNKFLYLYRSGILFGHTNWCFFPLAHSSPLPVGPPPPPSRAQRLSEMLGLWNQVAHAEIHPVYNMT